MALTEGQLLMLDTLIYANNPNDGKSYVSDGATVREIIDTIRENGYPQNDCSMSTAEWEELIDNINDETNLLDYTVTHFQENNSGMRAACFVDDPVYPTDVNAVFRGTQSEYEWHDNGQGGYVEDTYCQKESADYINGLPTKYGEAITVSGHSKGGNRAQYVTIVTDRVARCVSYDGQGFSEEFLTKYRDRIEERAHRIHSISAADDVVNCLLYSIAGIKTYVLTEDQGNDIFNYHKPNILLDESGNLRPEGAQSELSRFINEYTTYIVSNMPEPERSRTINGLIDGVVELLDKGEKNFTWETIRGAGTAVSYLDNFAFDRLTKLIFGPKGGVQLTRDFSDESKQKMLGLVSQVESEKWGDFTDWVGDRWYDFESWIGTLNIRHYIDNVNTYHKKVIDKNNTTEKKINEIFAAVRGVDASYGTTLANITRNLAEWKRFVATLSDILEPGRGNFNSQYISTKLNEVLSNISSANVQRIRDTLVQEVSGEPLYDVDLLLEYIKKNPGEMSDDEKQAVLGVIEELQETVAFYESAASIGDEQLGAAFWNRASWVSETNRFESFSAVSAHYNGVYMNVLDGILECGEDSNTFAASILKLSSGESDLSILGLDASADVNKLFGGSSLAAYVAKWKTEHTEQYFAKLEVSEKLDGTLFGKTKIKQVGDIEDAGNEWLEDKGKRVDESIAKYYDENGKEISKKEAGFYNRDYTIGEIDATASVDASLYDGKFDVGKNGDINVVVGNAEAHAGVSAGLYVIGANGEKQFMPGVSAEIGASATAFEADWEQQWLGDENLGFNTEVGLTAGEVGGKAEVEAQLFDKDGSLDLQLNAEAKLEAIAGEAEVSAGVNVLGGEVEATAGVNFGIGAHAEAGIKDGVVKLDVGLSIGVGVSLDVEIDVGGMVDTVVDGAEAAWDGIVDGWNSLWNW